MVMNRSKCIDALIVVFTSLSSSLEETEVDSWKDNIENCGVGKDANRDWIDKGLGKNLSIISRNFWEIPIFKIKIIPWTWWVMSWSKVTKSSILSRAFFSITKMMLFKSFWWEVWFKWNREYFICDRCWGSSLLWVKRWKRNRFRLSIHYFLFKRLWWNGRVWVLAWNCYRNCWISCLICIIFSINHLISHVIK